MEREVEESERKEEEAEPKVREGSSVKKGKNHTMKKSSKSPTFTEAGQRTAFPRFHFLKV